MPAAATFTRIYRLSAWYDLAVSLPFATPFALPLVWAALSALHLTLGLAPLRPLDVYGVLFGNFFGTVVTVWSVLRLQRDEVALARADAAGRFAFSTWMAVALWHGASPLLWGFLIVELGFGIAQSLPVQRRATENPPNNREIRAST